MSTATMRAKFEVTSILVYKHSETLEMKAVSAKTYDKEGNDENNTYAKFTPTASLNIVIANPSLFGKFRPGDQLYVDFSPASNE